MNFEQPGIAPQKEAEQGVRVEIEPGYEPFIPELFREQPVEYFESVGQNIKTVDVRWEDDTQPRVSSTAVKELPVWTDEQGKELHAVAKRVDSTKGHPASGDTFYEYRVIQTVHEAGLPAPKLIAKAQQQGIGVFVMEKVEGVSWYNKDELNLDRKGYSNDEITELYSQAETMMNEMKAKFDQAGIAREWKLRDMIFNIDHSQKKILSMTPTDWGRTEIDEKKLEAYKKANGLEG
jgi:hypothetical protein